jgi:hypothetical protein
MEFSEIEQETFFILNMYAALETSDSSIRFPGFDTEGEDASSEPYEGDHHSAAEKFRPVMLGRMANWPSKSHGRHLAGYRAMLDVWSQIGRKPFLSDVEVQRIRLRLRSVK